MIRYVFKRLLMLIPTLLAVSFIVYFIVDLAPGDDLDVKYGSEISKEELDAIREKMGYNDNVVIRYFRYMGRMLRGDLGVSSQSGESVFKLYMNKLPNTARLTLWGIAVSLIIAIPLGILAALKQNTWIDALCTIIGLAGISLPCFCTGLFLILLFASKPDSLLPSYGADYWYSIILPAITVGLSGAGLILRTTRSSMLEVIRQDYLRTARAKGVNERTIILKHALRNALIPIITVAGNSIAVNIGGAVITETVFAWPGVGRMIIGAIGARDINLVTGGIIMTTMISSILTLLVDIIYGFVDPRIKARYTK